MVSFPNVTHPIEPSLVDKLIDDQDDLKAYLVKKKIIDGLIAEARKNFSVLEKFKEKVLEAKKIILEILETTVAEALKKADKEKENVEKLIDYLESKKFAKNNSRDWADLLIEKCNLETLPLYSKQVKYLIGDVKSEIVVNSLKTLADVKTLNNPFKNIPTVYYIKAKFKEINFIDVAAPQTVNKIGFPAGLQLKDLGGWCEVATGCIIYCGGQENNKSTSECYQLDLVDSASKRLTDMLEPRYYSAVVPWKTFVYVLGGFQGKISLKSCEKYDFLLGTWTKIGDMGNCRSGFSTSVVGDKIYIAGDSKTIEIFNVSTETFEFLNVTLESSKSFITIVPSSSNRLILLQKDKSFEVNIEPIGVNLLKNIPVGDWWSQFSPVVYNKTAFFARCEDNSLWQMSLDSGSAKKIIKF